MIGLEISLGRDQHMGYEDYMNGLLLFLFHRSSFNSKHVDPRDAPVVGNVHAMADVSPYFK